LNAGQIETLLIFYHRETTMQQVKIFKSVDTESIEMEKQINRWMRKSGARVLSITGNLAASPASSQGPMSSFAGGNIMIIVLYEIDLPAKVRPVK